MRRSGSRLLPGRRHFDQRAAARLVRPDKPLEADFDHAGTPPRLAALRAVADETGASANQVVVAWLIGGDIPVIPLIGASPVAQQNDSLAAVDLEVTAHQRALLDTAR